MKFLAILVLATAAFGATCAQDLSDKEIFAGIIECARQSIVNGDPEINVPSHNPVLLSTNLSKSENVGLQTLQLDVHNMYFDGVSDFQLKGLEDVTKVKGVPIFNYDILWPLIRFTSTLRFSIKDRLTKLTILEQEGEFGFEFNDITFYGQFTFTKPAEGVEAGFNDVDLHFKTKDAKVHADGMGIFSSILEVVGAHVLRGFINLDILSGGTIVKNKLNRSWVSNPERIQKLVDHCKKKM